MYVYMHVFHNSRVPVRGLLVSSLKVPIEHPMCTEQHIQLFKLVLSKRTNVLPPVTCAYVDQELHKVNTFEMLCDTMAERILNAATTLKDLVRGGDFVFHNQ